MMKKNGAFWFQCNSGITDSRRVGYGGRGGVISWIIDLPDYEIIIASGKTGGEGVIAKKSLISQK